MSGVYCSFRSSLKKYIHLKTPPSNLPSAFVAAVGAVVYSIWKAELAANPLMLNHLAAPALTAEC